MLSESEEVNGTERTTNVEDGETGSVVRTAGQAKRKGRRAPFQLQNGRAHAHRGKEAQQEDSARSGRGRRAWDV